MSDEKEMKYKLALNILQGDYNINAECQAGNLKEVMQGLNFALTSGKSFLKPKKK